ncbi:alpha/beta fold hydrolase [Solitalea lacus]|uniref:alpha/beta fold hydrolase n=1 Tax=Solitalea lacus TaxID=2911172 RepID=UPI001EDB55DF|nr:alpha/beta hydrolase [Solitalea lacus]UKJ07162.1 alpha/beta hydrolase [Solitalea lacus]
MKILIRNFIFLVICILSTQTQIIAQQATKQITVNGVTLHYVEQGKGIPIILVHGAIGDYRTWEGQMNALSKNHRVIAYSRRYAYPNDTTDHSKGYSVAINAEDLIAFIKALKLGPVHLVGHSYGGYTALITAIKHPELVRSLTLGEPPVMSLLKNTTNGDSLLNQFVSNTLSPTGEALKNGDNEQALTLFLAGVIGIQDFYSNLPAETKQIMKSNLFELKGVLTSENVFPPTTCTELGTIKTPVLLLEGEKSPRLFHVINSELKTCLINKEYIIIPNASHGLELENPEAFNSTVLKFINDHK